MVCWRSWLGFGGDYHSDPSSLALGFITDGGILATVIFTSGVLDRLR